jgi:hypothetical protein
MQAEIGDLSGKPGKLNLAEKLLRLKGKWYGELSGRENEAHFQLGDCRIVAGGTRNLEKNYFFGSPLHNTVFSPCLS